MALPTAPVVAGSIVGGYVVARTTKIRPLGGAVLAAGGFVAQRQWRKSGAVNAAVLSAVYYGAFGVSHPLAKKIGAWPSVLTVASVAAAAAWVLSDRKR